MELQTSNIPTNFLPPSSSHSSGNVFFSDFLPSACSDRLLSFFFWIPLIFCYLGQVRFINNGHPLKITSSIPYSHTSAQPKRTAILQSPLNTNKDHTLLNAKSSNEVPPPTQGNQPGNQLRTNTTAASTSPSITTGNVFSAGQSNPSLGNGAKLSPQGMK